MLKQIILSTIPMTSEILQAMETHHQTMKMKKTFLFKKMILIQNKMSNKLKF